MMTTFLRHAVLSTALVFLFCGNAQAQYWTCKGDTGCTTVGSVCPNGSVFSGCSEGNKPIFATRCDAGQTWGGASCTGTASTFSWNNANAANYTTTGTVNVVNGTSNTTTLVATDSDSGTGGTQPHQAAAYCDGLSIHSKTDWYLPSAYELWVLYVNRTAIGNFSANTFWSSTEISNTQANSVTFTAGAPYLGYGPKQAVYRARCIRRD